MLDMGISEIQLIDELKQELTSNGQQFGDGNFYQSLPRLGISGMRPTDERIENYGLQEILDQSQTVLDLGCNCGFFDLTIADKVRSITGVEYNGSLVRIADKTREYLNIPNVKFICADYNEWKSEYLKNEEKAFDVVFSFAVHFWFKVSAYQYALDMGNLLKIGGVLLFETQDIVYNKEYPLFLREFDCRGFTLIKESVGCDDGKYTRKLFVYKKDKYYCGLRYLIRKLRRIKKIYV